MLSSPLSHLHFIHCLSLFVSTSFFFNHPATTEISTSLFVGSVNVYKRQELRTACAGLLDQVQARASAAGGETGRRLLQERQGAAAAQQQQQLEQALALAADAARAGVGADVEVTGALILNSTEALDAAYAALMCSTGHTGRLCADCVFPGTPEVGAFATSLTGSCARCPDRQDAWAGFIGARLLDFALMLSLVAICVLEIRARRRESQAGSRASAGRALCTMLASGDSIIAGGGGNSTPAFYHGSGSGSGVYLDGSGKRACRGRLARPPPESAHDAGTAFGAEEQWTGREQDQAGGRGEQEAGGGSMTPSAVRLQRRPRPERGPSWPNRSSRPYAAPGGPHSPGLGATAPHKESNTRPSSSSHRRDAF